MSIGRIIAVALVGVGCARWGLAQDRPGTQRGEPRRLLESRSGESTASAKTWLVARRDTTTSTNSEVFRDVTIASGKTLSLDSSLDYSSAATVAVMVECTACNTSGTSLGAAGLTLQARWSTPDADSFIATDFQDASSFPYWDSGGILFTVYGSQFRLTLQNSGSDAIHIRQIVFFRRNQ